MDSDERFIGCTLHVLKAFKATLDTSLPDLADKFQLSEESVRDAIGGAALQVALENLVAETNFPSGKIQDLQIHIQYLIHGAIAVAKEFYEDPNDE